MLTDLIGPRRLGWTLGAVCLLGLALRVYALNFGLPGVYNPDEIPILSRALAFAKGDLNPHNFLYPSLHFYALFLWDVGFFVLGRVVGLYASLADFQSEYFRDPSHVVLASRALTAVCGTATLVAVYQIGRRLFDRTTGVVAALFLAVAPFAVRDAHYIKLDVPVTLLTAITHAALARLVVDPDAAAKRRSWLWAGGLAGLAISTQYYVLFVVVTIAAVAIADISRSGRWEASAQRLGWAAGGTVAGFLAGTPFILVEMGTAMRDIAGVREVDVDRALAGGGGLFTSLPAYLRMIAVDAMGWPVVAAALVGVLVLLATDWRRAVVLVTFPVAYLVFIAHTVPMSRYVNCLLPMVAVAGAFALVSAARRLAPRTPAVAAALVAVAALPGLMASLRANEFYREADTRALARDFIERTVPSGASILLQPYSAPVRRSREGLVEALRANLGSESQASVKFQLQLAVSPQPPAYRTLYYGDGGLDVDKIYVLPSEFPPGADLTPLRRRGIQYVVLKRTDPPNPETVALEAALSREGRRLRTFSPYRSDVDERVRASVPPFLHNTAIRIDPALERPGPIVDVWQIN